MMQSNQMQPGVDGRTSGETTMLYGHCIIYIYTVCACTSGQWHTCVAMYFIIVACSGKQQFTSKTTSHIENNVSMVTCRCGPLPRVWLCSCFQILAGPVQKFAQFRLTSLGLKAAPKYVTKNFAPDTQFSFIGAYFWV